MELVKKYCDMTDDEREQAGMCVYVHNEARYYFATGYNGLEEAIKSFEAGVAFVQDPDNAQELNYRELEMVEIQDKSKKIKEVIELLKKIHKEQ